MVIYGGFAFRLAALALYQYGPVFLADLEPLDAKKEAATVFSYLLLIVNLCSIPLGMIIGILSDKFKSWKLLLIMTSITIVFYLVIALNAEIGYGLYVGIIGSALFVTTI